MAPRPTWCACLIFCISATFASLSGALLAVLFHYSVGSNYSSFNSLILVALVVISVCGMPWYGLIAAFGYTIIPGYVTISNINVYLEIAFGFFATMYAMNQRQDPHGAPAGAGGPRPVGRPPARAETKRRRGSPGRARVPSGGRGSGRRGHRPPRRSGRAARGTRHRGPASGRLLRWAPRRRERQSKCAPGPDHRPGRSQWWRARPPRSTPAPG